jgi:Alw26I/Eco31I/Esp3I family type II restriction m6 adenine DNA methyltransferase
MSLPALPFASRDTAHRMPRGLESLALPNAHLQKLVDKAARELRAATAAKIAGRFLSQYDEVRSRSAVAESPFQDHVDNFNHDRPLECLAFSLAVTKAAFKQVLASDRDLLESVFLCSRLVELGGYSISDPRSPDTSTTYLGAAKQVGYFFTPPSVAVLMAQNAIGERSVIRTALDPAAGCGALLAALLLVADKRGVTVQEVHGVEKDPFTSGLMRALLKTVASRLNCASVLRIATGDALTMYDGGHLSPVYDCVLMNPPYGRIKFLRSVLTNAETRVATRRENIDSQTRRWKQKTAALLTAYKGVAKTVGIHSGPLDYQRLFIAVAGRLLTSDGRCVFIAPSSWMSDKDSLSLRRQLIAERFLERLDVFAETCGLFATVNQPTAVVCLSKQRKHCYIETTVYEGRSMRSDSTYSVDVEKLMQLDPELVRIPRVTREKQELCEHLQSFPRLKSITSVCNARGELDLTLGKHAISDAPSSLRLVRGDHVERYVLRPAEFSSADSYVLKDVFQKEYRTTPKYQHFLTHRIACRQCAYIHKERRLSFTYIPPRHVLANSCNYVVAIGNDANATSYLKALLVVLNSAVVEWYFRIFNGNNHVANYEIDDFPIPHLTEALIQSLAACSDFLLESYKGSTDGGKIPLPVEDAADAIVAHTYGLSPPQVETIFEDLGESRGERVAAMVEYLSGKGLPRNLCAGEGWHQHSPPTLSSLDMEIIGHVPQGGNWMDVPESVPSKRLEQIRKMSEWRGVVRTTYYGRLRPEQPAYTIATYYNRPGNGTNIHPWADRTLTHREAARLQSFPDWYYFVGTDSSIRKQIGNAVPPLLSYAIARHLKSYVPEGYSGVVDLFAGAGGMSLGLELAGWQVVAAVEIDEQIGSTYEFNRPCERTPSKQLEKTLFLPCDLSNSDDRSRSLTAIQNKLGSQRLAAVMGGPPCQGFSHAGWRSDTDQRNHLAGNFLDIVKSLRPAIAVIENVEGLLSFDDGRVVQDLIEAMGELGYTVTGKPWVLCAEQYGVPQMRRRVFLVGTRADQPILPPPPLFEQCRGRKEAAKERTLFDRLPSPFTVGEALAGLPLLQKRRRPGVTSISSRSPDLMRRWLQGAATTSELVSET